MRRIVLVDQQRPNAFAEVVGAHDPAGERIFGLHLFGEAGAMRALGEQAERDLARQRAFALQRDELGLGPFAALGVERSEDLLKPVGREQPRDRRQICLDLGGRDGFRRRRPARRRHGPEP